MNILNIVLIVTLVIVSLGIFGLGLVHVTGHDARAYPVLPPDSTLEIAGRTLKISELAAAYQPEMHLRKNNPSPPLLWTWVEAVKTDTGVDLVYYQNWEDEINPNSWIHWFYRLFRSAYYGSPVRDIEYFQISISASSGEVERIRFETSPGDNFFVTFSEHVIANFHKNPDGSYSVIRTNRSGVELGRDTEIRPVFQQNRIQVMAQTWNHLTRLVSPSDPDLQLLPTALEFLSDSDYSSYKFVRKSQGDHRTIENQWTLRIGAFAYLIMLPAVFFLWIRRKRRKSDARKGQSGSILQ